MTRLRTTLVGTLITSLGLVACGPGSSNPDVPADTPITTDAMDTMPPPTDNGPTDVVNSDGGTCRTLPVENLNVIGMRTANGVEYVGDNTAARDSTSVGFQPPTGQTICEFRSTRQRVFVYTVSREAALRISTSNVGTSEGFNTTLAVALGPNCTSTTNLSFCNDNDATMAGVQTSRLTTSVQRMGARVFISVGGFVPVTGDRIPEGETGTFDLTVEEVAPTQDGMACDIAGQTAVCGINSTCVGNTILSEMGTCRANGSVAGAACATGDTCMGTLMCDPNNSRCFEQVADGMPCQKFGDAWQRCGMDSTCTNLMRGSVFGICRANGSAAGTTCNSSGMCPGAGLVCSTPAGATTGLCINAIARDGMCRTWDSACPEDQDCLGASPAGTPGMCVNDGSAATADCTGAGGCTAPLVCLTPTTGTPLCVNNAMTGGACGFGDQCPMTDTCYLTDPGNRYRGICRAPGGVGGNCRTTGTPCDTGLTCTNATDPSMGRCLTMGTVGGACRIFGTVSCPSGSSCLRTGSSGLDGRCTADGTAPGAFCRASGARCDGTLQCSSMTGSGICQTALTAPGAACDPRFATNRCPMGQSCRASGLDTGTCAAATMEMEPNDDVSRTQSIGAQSSVAGALSRFDLDCYSVMVPAMGRVFARVNSPNGFCYGGTTTTLSLDLYDSTGRLLGGDTNGGSFGCPRIDGSDTNGIYNFAANLPAGSYAVCVRNRASGGAAIPSYVLDVNASN